jgi:hypothetical protein
MLYKDITYLLFHNKATQIYGWMNNSVAFAGLPQGTDGSDALVGVNLGGGDGAAALGSAFFPWGF